MINTKDILITVLRVEEVYLLTTPCIGLHDTKGVVLKDVWIRNNKNPHLIDNHSMYRDELGTWWWFNDGELIQLPSAKVENFRYHYRHESMPDEESHLTGFNAKIEVLKTIYL